MKQIGILVACSALALTFGCEDGRSDGDGAITLMDSGPAVDGGPGDTGPGGASCDLSAMGLSGTGCLPRCANATLTAVSACTTGACQGMATNADTTPGVPLNGAMTPTTVDCGLCFNIQIISCIVESCDASFTACTNCAADQCDPATPGCEAEEVALMTCRTANMTTIDPCVMNRASMCFAAP